MIFAVMEELLSCNKCHQLKNKTDFSKVATLTRGYHYRCKSCIREDTKEYRVNNLEKSKKSVSDWAKRNRKHINAKRKERYYKNREEILEKNKINRPEWYKKNRSRILAYHRKYSKRQYDTNPQYKIKELLGCRIRALLRDVKTNKKLRTLDLIGCSPEFLVKHIESQFTPEMNWTNHGILWHLDHYFPCCQFDLTKEEEQRKCFHYSNLRPLLKQENLSKASEDRKKSIKNQQIPPEIDNQLENLL